MMLYVLSCYCSSCCSCLGDLFKTARGSVVSSRIRMKFCRIVHQANTHRLTESDFSRLLTFKMAAMTLFHTESATTWRVHMRRLPSPYAAASASSWSILHSYLLCETVTRQGVMERRLLNELFITRDYNKLERPVFNETDALTVLFGLTIQQIIDVVRANLSILTLLIRIWFDFISRSYFCTAIGIICRPA